MTILTVMQVTKIFCAYSIMTLILPALLLYRKIRDRAFTIRFMTYLTVGNFFMMSLVLLLQLLHISNSVTLTVFSILLFLALYALLDRAGSGQKEGMFLRGFFMQIRGIVRKCFAAIWRRFCNHKLDCLLTLVSIVAVLVMYGGNVFLQYGYGSSDIAMYDNWIHAMDQGELLVNGVFQFGFYCVIYYLHQVFGIETYVLLRLFWVVQILLIHLLLLAFIRMCCKLRAIAYVGLGVYILIGVFVDHSDSSYIRLLPREFGVIFILPALAFLFLFLEQKNRELYARKHEKQEKQDMQKLQLQEEERVYLLDEVLAESAAREASGQTFAAEPEDIQPETILTIERNEKDGSLFIKKVTLETQNDNPDIVEKTPEAVEEAETVDAMDVVKDSDTVKQGLCHRAGSTLKQEFSHESSQYLVLFVLNFSMMMTVPSYHMIIAGIFCLGIAFGFLFRLLRPQYFLRIFCAGISAITISIFSMLVAYNGEIPLQDSLQWVTTAIDWAQEDTKTFVPDGDFKRTDLHGFLFLSGPTVVSLSIALLFVLAVLYFILKQTDYAAKLMSVAVYVALLTLLFIAPGFGLPELADGGGRTCIFYAYSMIFTWILCADGIWNINVTIHGSKIVDSERS